MFANVKIRRDGNIVALIVDGRVSVRRFETEETAILCYEDFKARIVEAERETIAEGE